MGRSPKIIKRGKLSNIDKGKILHFVNTLGDTDEAAIQAANNINRPISMVKKYIKEIKQVFIGEEILEYHVKKNIVEYVISRLIGDGSSRAAAEAKVKKAIVHLTEDEQKKITDAELYRSCITMTHTSDLFITKSQSGRDGISILTEAASQKGDNIDRYPVDNPHVYKIK